MTKRVEIYVLLDPETREVRYVGKANNSAKRLKSHMSPSTLKRRTPVYDWINSLLRRALQPIMEVVQTVPAAEWQDAERAAIINYRENGARLLNLAEGGDEPHCPIEVRRENGRKMVCPPEVRSANARKVTEMVHSDPARKALWQLKRTMGQQMALWKKQGDYGDAYKKRLLTCMALGDFYPDRTPNSWRKLRWDEELLGEFTKEIMQTLMPESLQRHFDWSDWPA